MTEESQVNLANKEIIEKIGSSKVLWVGLRKASEAIPELKDKMLLHAGAPLHPSRMCNAMLNAVYGAIIYEGWATDLRTAELLVSSGAVKFDSAHNYSALGPMAGIISPSMPLMIFENADFGKRSFVTINEGLGQTLRFGANDAAVIKRLKWIEGVLSPILSNALYLNGPIDITNIALHAVQRGDECHNRNKAATSLLFQKMAPWLVETSHSRTDIFDALSFISNNEQFFLNLSMGMAEATMGIAHGIEGGTIVTCMASNGVEFGIKVSGSGEDWYTAPAGYAEGNYFKAFGLENANPVMGDSYMLETIGLGGFAMASAPGIAAFIGGTVRETVESTRKMYRITIAEHPLFKIPSMEFKGTPLGIDIRLVLKTGILPIVNTGIAHKEAGIGQIGAGRFCPPMECFTKAALGIGLVN
jgi:hypothetical protein